MIQDKIIMCHRSSMKSMLPLRRKWSLRIFACVVVLIACVSVAALVWKPLRQANTVRMIEDCGGVIYFSNLTDEHANEIKSWNFLQELMFPREYLAPIDAVDFRLSRRLSDECFDRLVECNSIRKLNVSGLNITNHQLEILSRMPGLTLLSIRDTEITDTAVPILGKFKSLYVIDISGTQITPEGQQHLLSLLPHCRAEDLTSSWSRLPAW
jgi:hypothetical protein